MSAEKQALAVFGSQAIACQPCFRWFCYVLRLENDSSKKDENAGLLARITEHRYSLAFTVVNTHLRFRINSD